MFCIREEEIVDRLLFNAELVFKRTFFTIFYCTLRFDVHFLEYATINNKKIKEISEKKNNEEVLAVI